jgi:hypothetical protein
MSTRYQLVAFGAKSQAKVKVITINQKILPIRVVQEVPRSGEHHAPREPINGLDLESTAISINCLT